MELGNHSFASYEIKNKWKLSDAFYKGFAKEKYKQNTIHTSLVLKPTL